MYIGTIIKEIRLKKNIPSKKLYKDILSRPAIVKFEDGISDTTVDRFFKILERLNISLDEFIVIYKKEENYDLYYTRSYTEGYYTKNILLLEKLIEKAKYDYNTTRNEKFRHYQAITSLLIDDLNESHLYNKELKIIQEYLINCDIWGYYEITLFANTLSFYSEEFIDLVYSKIVSTLLTLKNIKRYRNELALIIFNILEVKILNKNITSANFYLKELAKLQIETIDNMYIQTMITYFSLIIKLIEGSNNDNSILKIIEIFNFLQLNQKSEKCMTFYIKVKKIFNIS